MRRRGWSRRIRLPALWVAPIVPYRIGGPMLALRPCHVPVCPGPACVLCPPTRRREVADADIDGAAFAAHGIGRHRKLRRPLQARGLCRGTVALAPTDLLPRA
jgi:hypothetical protein